MKLIKQNIEVWVKAKNELPKNDTYVVYMKEGGDPSTESYRMLFRSFDTPEWKEKGYVWQRQVKDVFVLTEDELDSVLESYIPVRNIHSTREYIKNITQ